MFSHRKKIWKSMASTEKELKVDVGHDDQTTINSMCSFPGCLLLLLIDLIVYYFCLHSTFKHLSDMILSNDIFESI